MAISQPRLSTLPAPPTIMLLKLLNHAQVALICPVIFVRIGNLRRGPLLAKFESVMHNLIQALNNGDKIIEIA